MSGRFLTSLDELVAYMKEKGEKPWRIPDGFSLSPRIRGDEPTMLEITWVPEYSVVRFTLGLPIMVPPEHQDAILRLTGKINMQIALRGFVGITGVAFVTHALLNHDGTLSTEVVDRSIELCVKASEKYFDELERTAKDLPPAEPSAVPPDVAGEPSPEPPAVVPEAELHARSVAEEHLYLALHPCVCGQGGSAGLNHGVRNDGDDLVSHYAGPCPACGRMREILFVRPEKPVSRGSFGGDELSRIITPGEFLRASEVAARRVAPDPSGLSLEHRARLRAELLHAITYLEEAMKFIPAGKAEAVHRSSGAQLSRARFDVRLAAYRELLSRYDSG